VILFFNFFVETLKPTAVVEKPCLTEPERPLDLTKPVFMKRTLSQEESCEKRKSRFLSKQAVSILQTWYHNHRDHPYATDEEVRELAEAGNITPNQV